MIKTQIVEICDKHYRDSDGNDEKLAAFTYRQVVDGTLLTLQLCYEDAEQKHSMLEWEDVFRFYGWEDDLKPPVKPHKPNVKTASASDKIWLCRDVTCPDHRPKTLQGRSAHESRKHGRVLRELKDRKVGNAA